MPYVNIKVTKEGGPDGTGPSPEQKAELIKGTTDLLARVLNKDPSATFVVIDEVGLEDWGIGGLTVPEYRKQQSKHVVK
ncbi:4-oxalocrotonate tautomerase family protein [Sneathiella marina]|uniref:Tautomerase n=1 Tax=Sneathiella marina TaxID=2950108 RepID=A0ABY4W5E0_9PROT|nr:4-oxalocrotonate tautomerase family protein [Sneathiella marina]USG62039.1 4-oxalocrotonate tautomerase family protein [Sneathiella marina]